MGNILKLFEAPREQVMPLLPNDFSSRYSAEITSQSEKSPPAPKPETDGWRLSPRNKKNKKRKRSRSRSKSR